MTCEPEKVTGHVDGALPPADAAAVESHLAACPACAAQARDERALRVQLRALPVPEPRRGLEMRVRDRLRPRRRFWRPAVLLPLAAMLAVVLWTRGLPGWVSFQLARDHRHCFSYPELPYQIQSTDPREVEAWFAENGAEVPPLPASGGGLDLAGARFCPLLDRRVAHVYYQSGSHHLSMYVVTGPARFPRVHATTSRGQYVRLVRVAGMTVGLVADRQPELEGFEQALVNTRASAGGGAGRGAAGPVRVALAER